MTYNNAALYASLGVVIQPELDTSTILQKAEDQILWLEFQQIAMVSKLNVLSEVCCGEY